MRKNKILNFIILIATVVLLMPFSVSANKNSKLIQYTPQRTEDTFRYLNDIYIEKYPELGLRNTHGSKKDNDYLQNIAELITYGCKSDEEKATAIVKWIRDSIVYEENSVYPIDTFFERKGQCLGIAQLLQDLLRKLDIPAVVSDGFRVNTQSTSFHAAQNDPGHAWCFVYINGEWVLYDPLFSLEPITDRNYIAKWYYILTVEWVLPIYDTDDMPPLLNNEYTPAYTNGKYVLLGQDGNILSTEIGNAGFIINNLNVSFEVYLPEYDTWISQNQTNGNPVLVSGDLYYDKSDLYYSNNYNFIYRYIYENGMLASLVTLDYKDKSYFIHDGGSFYDVQLNFDDYTTMFGMLAVPLEYTGKTLFPTAFHEFNNDEYTFTWSTTTPEKISLLPDGNLTTLATGIAQINVQAIRTEDEAIMADYTFGIYIYDSERVPDYRDKRQQHTHNYELYVTSTGLQFATCNDLECADSYETGKVFRRKDSFIIEGEHKKLQYVKGAIQQAYLSLYHN